MIPAASSRGLSDGGSGVGESVACNDSRLCTSSCCLCGNRWEYVLSVVDTLELLKRLYRFLVLVVNERMMSKYVHKYLTP